MAEHPSTGRDCGGREFSSFPIHRESSSTNSTLELGLKTEGLMMIASISEMSPVGQEVSNSIGLGRQGDANVTAE